MTKSLSLSTVLVGLALSGTALAQVPPSAGATNQTMPPPPPSVAYAVTQSSRIRAFNPGADGQVKSLYLSNGSVVDLPPDMGPLGTQIKNGERVSVSGLRSNVSGQTILAANSVTVNGQTFVSRPGLVPIAGANMLPPPPPPPGAPNGPPHRGARDMARLGPQVPGTRDAADSGLAPADPRPSDAPPPPRDPRADRADGVPPPPLPENVNRPAAPPPPPPGPDGSAQPNTPAPPAGRPEVQPQPLSAPPVPNDSASR